MSVHYPTDDCEDCGRAIEYGTPDGTIQPDAEVSCPGCGAMHIVNVGDDSPAPPHVYLTLVKSGGEVIAELTAEIARLNLPENRGIGDTEIVAALKERGELRALLVEVVQAVEAAGDAPTIGWALCDRIEKTLKVAP